MKHIHTPSHTFMAVKFETTGNVERNPFEVVKKLSIVVTPEIKVYCYWREHKRNRHFMNSLVTLRM